MTISYIKKANKTASSDEVETRQKVQQVLNEIESKRDEGIKEISRKFDKYEGDVIISQEKIEEVIKENKLQIGVKVTENLITTTKKHPKKQDILC